jgi:hypothetical protein
MTYKDILLTSEAYVRSQTDLDDNLLGKVLLPAIKLAQDIELQTALGTRLYRSLQQKVFDETITETGNTQYQELLDDYVQPFLAYQTLANCVSLARAKVANIGVVNTTDTNVNSEGKPNADLLKNDYLHFAHHYLKVMQNWLKVNKEFFEELDDCHPCDQEGFASHLNSAANSPIWLGGYRSKKVFGIDM